MNKSIILLSTVALTIAAHQAQSAIVATDQMESTGDYTYSSIPNVPLAARSDQNLTPTAGSDYIAISSGVPTTKNLNFNISLTGGFSPVETVQAGIYTASIDIGKGDLARDSFNTFDFSLATTAASNPEIGIRTIVTPYAEPTIGGSWNTITISYEVLEGSARIGETLTWKASGNFTSESDGIFGAMDNVQVSYVPEPGTYGLLGGLAAFAAVMLRRQRSLR